jgi:energy-coupling factor transporter ATP-binding protein EcfA2
MWSVAFVVQTDHLAPFGDNPISTAQDDALGRGPLAEAFARTVLGLDVSSGAVVGVLGPWGSGKTSFVNMARLGFADANVPVLDFNPWMFSGAEQLVESFFVELSAQLKLRPGLGEIGKELAEYGEAFVGVDWLPLVGPWVVRARGAASVLGRYLQRRQEGSQGRRTKLTKALEQLEHPVVVVLDDIDRLSTPEIRDVFKLVRLTASFPNIVYVVAFDRARVEKALGEEGIPGRDYLEKILQVAIDLPVVPQEVMIAQITGALDQALSGSAARELDAEVWPDIFMEIIRPLVGNMRDVRRYAAAVRVTVGTVGDQIALADLLAMEAIRVFLPDVYAQIQVSVDGLCTPSSGIGGARFESLELKGSIDRLLEVAGDQESMVRDLLRRLFPFSRRHFENNSYGTDFLHTFLRDRRIAHRAILELYLERVAGKQLVSFQLAEQAWALVADEAAFEEFLRALPAERQEDVIAALESYERECQPGQVIAAAPVLLNLAGELPERPRGMFDVDSRFVVGKVVYRLLRSLDGQEVVADAVGQILTRLRSLSAKFELLTLVGYREGAGHKLVSEADAETFEAAWRTEVRAAGPEHLADEYDLLRVFYWARHDSAPEDEAIPLSPDPIVTLAVLRSARSETRGQTSGNRAVRRTSVFAWSTLVEVYGGEDSLIARIEALKGSGLEIPEELMALIEKYLAGWRPRDFAAVDDDED